MPVLLSLQLRYAMPIIHLVSFMGVAMDNFGNKPSSGYPWKKLSYSIMILPGSWGNIFMFSYSVSVLYVDWITRMSFPRIHRRQQLFYQSYPLSCYLEYSGVFILCPVSKGNTIPQLSALYAGSQSETTKINSHLATQVRKQVPSVPLHVIAYIIVTKFFLIAVTLAIGCTIFIPW